MDAGDQVKRQAIWRMPLLLCIALAPAGLVTQACASPSPAQAGIPLHVAGQPALELRIFGPKIIHRSDRVEFKATLINRSTAPVLISPSERSRAPIFATWWDATAESGAAVGQEQIGYCPVDGLDYSHKWRLTDISIRLLQPGESAEVPVTFPDPRTPLKFRKKGTYQLTLHYFFSPPGREADTKDGKLVLTNYETGALSPTKIKALREATSFSAVSAPFTIILE
jgi:hypothetical protein